MISISYFLFCHKEACKTFPVLQYYYCKSIATAPFLVVAAAICVPAALKLCLSMGSWKIKTFHKITVIFNILELQSA